MPTNKFTNFPSGFARGVTVRNLPIVNTHWGNIFFVDSGTGSDNGYNRGTPTRPFATIDFAVGRCTANNGDLILVAPGHTETLAAAAAIALDVAGITVLGLGNGRDRPTLNFTDTASDIDVDAANVTLANLFLDLTGVDAVVAGLDVNAADFTFMDCEVLMADSGGQATEFILTDANADRMRVIGNVIRAPNAGANNAISIEGTPDGIEIIGNHIYGDFADAPIHNPTANVATNLRILNNYLQNDQTGDHAIELVSACTGIFDGNVLVTDAIATAADLGSLYAGANNVFFDSSDTDATGTPYPEAVTTGGHGLFQIADRLGTDLDTDDLGSILVGASGIGTFPAAAAPANSVSLAEVIRSIYDRQLGDGTDASTNSRLGLRVTRAAADVLDGTTTALFTVSSGRVLITHLEGEVTGAIVDATVSNTKFVSNPTTGTDVDLCAVLDVQGDEVGTLYTITGTFSDALQGGSAGASVGMDRPVVVPEGTIDLSSSADAGTGGAQVKFELWYIPLDDSASVASA